MMKGNYNCQSDKNESLSGSRYTEKSKGSSIEPWGTPTAIINQTNLNPTPRCQNQKSINGLYNPSRVYIN